MHAIKETLFNDKIIALNWFARVFLELCAMHEVSCMNWNTGKVICLIGEWENEDSIRLDAAHLCKIDLSYSGIVLGILKCIILTHQENILKRK